MNDTEQNLANCEKALGCWFLTGATAVGKTEVGLELAKTIDAEIISLDSMAIYRGMNIGTAKPTSEQRAVITHHLLDICDPTEKYSVTQYRDAALQTIDEIQSRGKQVLFVGGTALYLKALICGIFQGPPANWDFRNTIQQELTESDLEQLHERLAQVDPVSAHKLHPNDQRRVIRALEVYTTTGQPISHLQNEFEMSTDPEKCKVFTLRRPRAELHQRIENRVGQMFERGLVEEVRELLQQWETLGQTAGQAVGYQEVINFIDAESTDQPGDLTETREKVLVRTRRFARHQETWFRGIDECRILDIDANWSAPAVVESILEMSKKASSKPA